MEKIKLWVSGSQIEVAEHPAVITSGTVGLVAEFVFDSQWDTLDKIVVFKAGDRVITTGLEKDSRVVPWEVLEKPGQWLSIGVYGANAEGTVVIPTLWAKVSVIHTGVDPEGDPAMDPTAPFWQENVSRVEDMADVLRDVDSLAADNKNAIDSHIHNRKGDNPHNVTCEQLGAVSQQKLQTNVEAILIADYNNRGRISEEVIYPAADGSTMARLEEYGLFFENEEGDYIGHAYDTNNPHEVTAEQIGAAPAGYGCGESAPKAQNWNTQYRNGFYRESANSPDGSVWYGITCVDSSNYQSQIAFIRNNDNGLIEARRNKFNSAWSEWEYVNPPMLPGVEYRTTERWKGKPVYTKLIELPIVEENIEDDMLIYDLDSGVDTIVSAEYREKSATDFHFNDRDKCLVLDEGHLRLFLYVTSDEVTDIYEATLLLKYTKTNN